jgi:hypothetical protein
MRDIHHLADAVDQADGLAAGAAGSSVTNSAQGQTDATIKEVLDDLICRPVVDQHHN